MKTLENAITDKTRLVAIAQVSNVLGRTAPIEKDRKTGKKTWCRSCHGCSTECATYANLM